VVVVVVLLLLLMMMMTNDRRVICSTLEQAKTFRSGKKKMLRPILSAGARKTPLRA
jgi:hypothetical protein